MRSLLGLIVLLFAAAAAALSTTGNRLLAILDNVDDKALYSQFFGDLKARGFDVDYETPRTDGLKLSHLGERIYDHIIFFPTKVKGLGPNLTPSLLLDFVKAGGNILVAMSSTMSASTSVTNMLSELEISLPPERTGTVVDHFNYDTVSAAEAHDVLVLDAPVSTRPGLKNLFEMPDAVIAMPRVAGHVLGQSQLLTPVLRAPATAYSYNPKEQPSSVEADELFAAGSQLALVSTVQVRNSARVTVLGSAEMLQDSWMDGVKVARLGGAKVKPENREFAKRLTGWTFQEIGVLRVNSVEHRLQGQNETNPGIYRVKTDVAYTISLSEHSWDKWVPFAVPEEDSLQLEFSMLSPFHRLDLASTLVTETATIFSKNFTLPDQHGIFNFKVNYKRPFLTYIEDKQTVSVRHMAHDEWPRSYVISGAWPWLSGIATTVVGFVGFSALWMYSKPTGKVAKKA
ncbi:hypothetical protein HIM_04646 [Hirsutella minnesotensis 3608]|uniref:Dolichyl-diphosphooligosaccharide--protein glycosyltransferase subunit WBP1 n=1 Tax=Hirsutella minnesotensis 3608 TaxID=1043627 RepID=A0A0F8A132_9HYPO|nr:hypothetical protein HIM_04646 [Hirsutella minnesotensis 3608]